MILSFNFLNSKVLLIFSVTLLFRPHFSFATSNPTGLTLRFDVDDSPGSPMYRIQNLSIDERIDRLIHVSNARANYLNLISNSDTTILPDNIRIPLLRESSWYAVEFTIGSQGQRVKLLMDTGGGLIWTQCQPCLNYFPQKLPIYDPRVSTTYATLPCEHRLCKTPGKNLNCVDGLCRYAVSYGGGTSTKGVLSTETFHFLIDKTNTRDFNVVFGCSNDTTKVSFQNTEISGIFGVSISPDSMARQFSTETNSRFSYCFAPFDGAVPPPLVLRFGEDIPKFPAGHLQSTLVLQPPPYRYFYYLQLLDISVGNYRIGFPPSTFQFRAGGAGGCFIDSGAMYTFIDAGTIGVNAYERVMSTFIAYYGSKGLQRRPGRSFEVCYVNRIGFNEFASLTFHFNGADYTVDGGYVNVFKQGYFCVGILKGPSKTVLGAWHQQNKRIIHDELFGELQFADENCANDVA
ncbi:putative Monovalent cation:proton antiporter [Hibiscus syriacus]|uniref:Monovalent cation:proton antiporter n=1 Tax=Hibiscus syriacus TaxID=106335 RepID=A0A6A3CC74_HIBSY|nr:aspartic proteinase nepenthesin-1-like [Hibiscus syriacus]KAE8726790.1 putative Monovalent cation:proton antiporter [Hibiscus syriacus]